MVGHKATSFIEKILEHGDEELLFFFTSASLFMDEIKKIFLLKVLTASSVAQW